MGDDPELAAALVRKLPDLHLTVLSFLIKFLQLFVRPEVVNITKMDASNLSMVFAPNFLRWKELMESISTYYTPFVLYILHC